MDDLSRAERKRRARAKLRMDVFAHYGLECAACREADFDVLTIDHVYNDGSAHRLSLTKHGAEVGDRRGGCRLYRWLQVNGYPEGFQTLCMNCNYAKFRNGGTVPLKRIVKGSKLYSDSSWVE